MADQRHDSVDPGPGVGPEAETSFPGRLERFLSDCAEVIADFAGPGGARAVYLCGSFAAGEGSVAFEAGVPLFLSDVDLVLVVDTMDAHRAAYRRRREMAAACEERFPEARFAGHVDVGVLLAGELGGLVPSPGVFDMRHVGRVLIGDPYVLELLPAFDQDALGASAARLLCENRIASLLGTAEEPPMGATGGRPVLEYAISRVYTDILTAELCSAGEYRPSYAERLRWLRDDPAARPVRDAFGAELNDRIAGWTAYKLRPSPDLVPRGGKDGLWLEAAAGILSAWKRAASAEAALDTAAAQERPVDELIALRPRSGQARVAMRRWIEYWRRHRDLTYPAAAALALERFREGTPDDQVRREAVRLIDAALRKGLEHQVDGPTMGFPHHGGPFPAAANETSLTWRNLVRGKEE